MIVRFDELELDLSVFELRRAGQRVPMEPQAFEVLAYLVEHRDRLVSKEELMDGVWGGRFVSETAITSRIKQVRRAVGDDGNSQRLIRTVHGRGYRFVASVLAPENSRSARSRVPVLYAESDGLNIAYQVTGQGTRDIVLVAGFVSHLELDWADPRHAHFLNRLSSFGRLIRFDKRGTGCGHRPRFATWSRGQGSGSRRAAPSTWVPPGGKRPTGPCRNLGFQSRPRCRPPRRNRGISSQSPPGLQGRRPPVPHAGRQHRTNETPERGHHVAPGSHRRTHPREEDRHRATDRSASAGAAAVSAHRNAPSGRAAIERPGRGPRGVALR